MTLLAIVEMFIQFTGILDAAAGFASSKWTPSFMIEDLDFLAIPTKGFLKKCNKLSKIWSAR